MSRLKLLSETIFQDITTQNRKHYKKYAQQLMQLVNQSKDNDQSRTLLSISFYNLSKLSNSYKHIILALEFKSPSLEKVKWNLQMLALASSRGSHQEAYLQACKLIQLIAVLIQNLQLESQHEMFAREMVELTTGNKNPTMSPLKTLNQIQFCRKFKTECSYVNKTFHIADIMIIEPININSYHETPQLKPDEIFFYYVVFLAIACFTRATEKFYCRDSSDKEYHFKAIEIAGYLYSSKSTFMRFLKRTYKQHYLEQLDEIQELDEGGDLKVKVVVDPDEVSMISMPWIMDDD